MVCTLPTINNIQEQDRTTRYKPHAASIIIIATTKASMWLPSVASHACCDNLEGIPNRGLLLLLIYPYLPCMATNHTMITWLYTLLCSSYMPLIFIGHFPRSGCLPPRTIIWYIKHIHVPPVPSCMSQGETRHQWQSIACPLLQVSTEGHKQTGSTMNIIS